ncbi:MAG: hypothetical protein LBT80_01610 [Lactobacillaceae bacterium]|jgi:Zn-dependent peptidase ImmA (M78 family)|nr:hypothetical protein [Lactobacillaceae bacterium]
MNQQNLINELVDLIRIKGFAFMPVDHLDAVAVININKAVGMYDVNAATPFDIAHEYFHIIHNDTYRKNDYDIRNPQEKDANESAVELLLNMYKNAGGTMEHIQNFIDITGAPDYWVVRLAN